MAAPRSGVAGPAGLLVLTACGQHQRHRRRPWLRALYRSPAGPPRVGIDDAAATGDLEAAADRMGLDLIGLDLQVTTVTSASLRGALGVCVLQILLDGPNHGYAISRRGAMGQGA